MSGVSIRDLRKYGGEVIDRVAAGERVTVTRAGRPVYTCNPSDFTGIHGLTVIAVPPPDGVDPPPTPRSFRAGHLARPDSGKTGV